jgi:hypothetical protein
LPGLGGRMTATLCALPDCGRKVAHLTFCRSHYYRWLDNPSRPNAEPCSVEGCAGAAHARGLCRNHYARLRNRGTTAPRPRPSFLDRFWSKVDVGAPGECWEWKGTKTRYGVLSARAASGKVHIGAHRLSWELHNGVPIPSGMMICHRCDNPPCVNPAHLYTGSAADNSRDMVERGRSRYQSERAIADLVPCGTSAAYARHLRRGEKPCAACREDRRLYTQRRRARLRERAS